MEVVIHSSAIHFFSYIQMMLEDNYKEDPKYKDVVFVLGYHLFPSLQPIRSAHPNKKVIIYQLEQHEYGRPWTTTISRRTLSQADEIWDYDIDNINWLKKNWGLTSSLHPVMYSRSLQGAPNSNPQYDIIFYGAHNNRRDTIITNLQQSGLRVDWIGAYGNDLLTYIQNSKIILNLHHYIPPRQEQTRIFIPIINARCVISEPSPRNYFKGMIIESPLEKLVDTCTNYLKDNVWKHFGEQANLKFKNRGLI